ncbi:hypothetical protein PR048_001100 [Dryococelus australis]|uniref:Nesprin-1 spectrin repeats region domain-containing protein n=1 Tax=Dryococelus australis TaxID=614101 RepID=A0ABQ9IH22_9NEOP|nr:hypothetical protein PR048_001100 [Dryococelus australis]
MEHLVSRPQIPFFSYHPCTLVTYLVLVSVLSTDQRESANIDRFMRETGERWKNVSMELRCVQSMLEEVVAYWRRWNSIADEFETWLDRAYGMLDLSQEDKMEYFQVRVVPVCIVCFSYIILETVMKKLLCLENYHLFCGCMQCGVCLQDVSVWKDKHQLLGDTVSFLIATCEDQVARELKERYMRMCVRWDELFPNVKQYMHAGDILRHRKDYRTGIEKLQAWLRNAEAVLSSSQLSSTEKIKAYGEQLQVCIYTALNIFFHMTVHILSFLIEASVRAVAAVARVGLCRTGAVLSPEPWVCYADGHMFPLAKGGNDRAMIVPSLVFCHSHREPYPFTSTSDTAARWLERWVFSEASDKHLWVGFQRLSGPQNQTCTSSCDKSKGTCGGHYQKGSGVAVTRRVGKPRGVLKASSEVAVEELLEGLVDEDSREPQHTRREGAQLTFSASHTHIFCWPILISGCEATGGNEFLLWDGCSSFLLSTPPRLVFKRPRNLRNNWFVQSCRPLQMSTKLSTPKDPTPAIAHAVAPVPSTNVNFTSQYIGLTTNTFRQRMNGHRADTKQAIAGHINNLQDKPLATWLLGLLPTAPFHHTAVSYNSPPDEAGLTSETLRSCNCMKNAILLCVRMSVTNHLNLEFDVIISSYNVCVFIQKLQNEVEGIEDLFKAVSKKFQVMIQDLSRDEVDRNMNTLKKEKEALVRVRALIPMQLHLFHQILVQQESLEAGQLEISRWLDEAEALLTSESLAGGKESVQAQLDRHKKVKVAGTGRCESRDHTLQAVRLTADKLLCCDELFMHVTDTVIILWMIMTVLNSAPQLLHLHRTSASGWEQRGTKLRQNGPECQSHAFAVSFMPSRTALFFSRTLYYKSMMESKNKVFQSIVKSVDHSEGIDTEEFRHCMLQLNERFARVTQQAQQRELKLQEAIRCWHNFRESEHIISDWLQKAEKLIAEKHIDTKQAVESHKVKKIRTIYFFDQVNERWIQELVNSAQDLRNCLPINQHQPVSETVERLQAKWKEVLSFAPLHLMRLEFRLDETTFTQYLKEIEKEIHSEQQAFHRHEDVEAILTRHKEFFMERRMMSEVERNLNKMSELAAQYTQFQPSEQSLQAALSRACTQYQALTSKVDSLQQQLQQIPQRWKEYQDRTIDGKDTVYVDCATTVCTEAGHKMGGSEGRSPGELKPIFGASVYEVMGGSPPKGMIVLESRCIVSDTWIKGNIEKEKVKVQKPRSAEKFSEMVKWMDSVDESLKRIVTEVNSLEEFEKERTVFQVCTKQ